MRIDSCKLIEAELRPAKWIILKVPKHLDKPGFDELFRRHKKPSVTAFEVLRCPQYTGNLLLNRYIW